MWCQNPPQQSFPRNINYLIFFRVKRKVNFSTLGHSFGGATTLLTLAKDTRFKMGLVLDGWLFPIRDEELAADVKQPVLFINTGHHFSLTFHYFGVGKSILNTLF